MTLKLETPEPVRFMLAGYEVFYTPFRHVSKYNRRDHALAYFDNVVIELIGADLRCIYLEELKKRGVL